MVSIDELKRISSQVRRDIIRMVTGAKSGHPGGSMSSTDFLTALYFGGVMKHDPATWTRSGKGQDVFIPVSCIKNIGEDVVIVDIGSLCGAPGVPPREEPCRPRDIPQAASGADLGAGEEDPGCDHRCDKCMLFDCRFRWKGKAF